MVMHSMINEEWPSMFKVKVIDSIKVIWLCNVTYMTLSPQKKGYIYMTIPTVPNLLTKELALEQNQSMNRHNTTPGKDLTNQFSVPVPGNCIRKDGMVCVTWWFRNSVCCYNFSERHRLQLSHHGIWFVKWTGIRPMNSWSWSVWESYQPISYSWLI